MDDYLEFEGQIVTMPWGKSTYTVLPIPNSFATTLQHAGARRVEGEIAEHPVNLALTKSPALDQVFVYTGKSFLRETGLAPNETVSVRLRPAPDAEVDAPEDLIIALRRAGQTARWDTLTPGRQRGLIHTITSAKRAETRAKRIAKVISDIA